MLANWLRELLNGVAEHGAWHAGFVSIQPGHQPRLVMLAGLTQHPAHSFLQKIVQRLGLVKEYLRDGECVVHLSAAYELQGADYADALLPDAIPVARQIVQQAAILVHEPLSQKLIARKVDKVPVVDERRVRKIEVHAPLLHCNVLFCVLEDLNECQQGGEAHFVIFVGDAFFQIVEGGLFPQVFDNTARDGDLDAQELIALAVLAGTGLEEARESSDLRRVAVRQHSVNQHIHITNINVFMYFCV